MKLLLLAVLLTGCAHSKYPLFRDSAPKKKEITHIDRMYNCVIRLIERDGIGARESQEVCDKTLRRQ